MRYIFVMNIIQINAFYPAADDFVVQKKQTDDDQDENFWYASDEDEDIDEDMDYMSSEDEDED